MFETISSIVLTICMTLLWGISRYCGNRPSLLANQRQLEKEESFPSAGGWRGASSECSVVRDHHRPTRYERLAVCRGNGQSDYPADVAFSIVFDGNGMAPVKKLAGLRWRCTDDGSVAHSGSSIRTAVLLCGSARIRHCCFQHRLCPACSARPV